MKPVMRLADATPFFVLFEFKSGAVIYTEDVLLCWIGLALLTIFVFVQAGWFGVLPLLLLVGWFIAVGTRAPWSGDRLPRLQAKLLETPA